jgi:hypothetical protein
MIRRRFFLPVIFTLKLTKIQASNNLSMAWSKLMIRTQSRTKLMKQTVYVNPSMTKIQGCNNLSMAWSKLMSKNTQTIHYLLFVSSLVRAACWTLWPASSAHGPRRGKGREGTSPARCRQRRWLGRARPGRMRRGHGDRSALVAGGDGDGFAIGDDHCSGREDLDLASYRSPSGTSLWCRHLPS